MVTIAAGAIAVGIVSVCAIPFGCFVSRLLRKKVLIPPEVANDPESDSEVSFERFDMPARNPALVLNRVEAGDESEYEIEELSSRHDKRRAPRVEIRVLVSNGTTRSIDVDSQGYVTASRSSGSTSPQRKYRRRLSLPHLAAGPATGRQIKSGSSSLPISGRNQQQESRDDDRRVEITISGGFSKSIAQFGEFKNYVQDASTPKSRQSSKSEDSTEYRENLQTDTQRSSFWRRASFGRNGPPKIFKTTRAIEVIDIEVIPGDEMRLRRKMEPQSMAEEEKLNSEEERKRGRKNRKPETEGPSQEKGKSCDREKWGLSSRFLETLKEATSFAAP